MKKDLDQKFGNVRVRIMSFGGFEGPPSYNLPPQAWRRGAQLIGRFGVEGALELLDARAEKLLQEGNIPAAIRWRNVMAAIHAVQEDERCPGEPNH